MRHRLIYLDNSTTTRPSERAIGAMMPYLSDRWGHASAPHQKGEQLQQSLADHLKTLYQFIGASLEDTVLFTSSGVEAINQVIQSVYRNVTLPTGKNHYITSSLDEAPAILSMGHLEALGCLSKSIPASNQGFVTADSLANILSPRTALVSLSWANGLTGVIQPIEEIAALCHQRGILLHLDATHVLGKLVYDLKEVNADFITFNGSHLHAPKGTGGLYIKNGIKCSPLLLGGSEQGGLRAGEINMAGLSGLATAAQEAMENRDFLSTEVSRLRDKLEKGVISSCPNATPLFQDQNRLPHCTAIAFPGILNEALLFLLNRKGLCASIGGNQMQQLALLLTASKIESPLAYSALSFSLSRYTSEEEIDHAIYLITEAVQQLLKTSSRIIL
jgi:cysteine desulfurase